MSTGPGIAGLSRIATKEAREAQERARDAIQRLAGATVLVTGAAGFLPAAVIDALVSANDAGLGERRRVIGVDNHRSGTPTRLAHLRGRADVALVDQDLSRGCEVDETVDFVVHGASIASPTWYRRHPLQTLDVNVSGTRYLLELAREQDVAGYLQLSSSEIYGDPPPEKIPTSEDYWGHVSTLGPRACYDESKRLGETLCWIYHHTYGVPLKIVRPFNVYGPGLRLDDGRVIPDFISDALAGRPITVYSDGRITRSFCYVTDAVTGLLLLLTAPTTGEAFNLGNDDEISIEQTARVMDDVTGGRCGVRFETSADVDYLTDNPQRRCPDLRKIRATIDWAPQVSLREGLERTLAHYREVAAA